MDAASHNVFARHVAVKNDRTIMKIDTIVNGGVMVWQLYWQQLQKNKIGRSMEAEG